jgi:hypothetical protein
MEVTIKVHEKSISKTDFEYKFIVTSDTIEVKELILERVKQEVLSYNENIADTLKQVDMSNAFETALNDEVKTVLRNKRKLEFEDIEKQYYTALDGFKKNKYFIFVNNKQYLNLDDKITVTHSMSVLFIRITPLVGG